MRIINVSFHDEVYSAYRINAAFIPIYDVLVSFCLLSVLNLLLQQSQEKKEGEYDDVKSIGKNRCGSYCSSHTQINKMDEKEKDGLVIVETQSCLELPEKMQDLQ